MDKKVKALPLSFEYFQFGNDEVNIDKMFSGLPVSYEITSNGVFDALSINTPTGTENAYTKDYVVINRDIELVKVYSEVQMHKAFRKEF